MNKFEALHALGLEDGATDDEIRLAYYGLEKSIQTFDFSENERLARMMNGMLENAQESRRFLLKNYVQNDQPSTSIFSRRKKVTKITPTEEKLTRLHGMERIRNVINNFLGDQLSRRGSCIVGLVACGVVGFVLVRGIHGVMRFGVAAIILAIAVALSILLTNSLTAAKQSRGYLVEIDGELLALRRELGIAPEEEPEETEEESPHWWVRWWKRVRAWWSEHRPRRRSSSDDTEA